MANTIDNLNLTAFNHGRDRNLFVGQVAFVGSIHQGPRAMRTPLHWRIFLQMSETSVILNMTTDERPGDPLIGTLHIQSKDYQITENRQGIFIPQMKIPITVGQFIEVLLKKGRARYMYNENGRGCRWWCETVLEDMVAVGLFDSSSIRNFRKYIQRGYESNPLLFPMPTTEGCFFNP